MREGTEYTKPPLRWEVFVHFSLFKINIQVTSVIHLKPLYCIFIIHGIFLVIGLVIFFSHSRPFFSVLE